MKRSLLSIFFLLIFLFALPLHSVADPVYPPYDRIQSITPAHGTTGLPLAFNVEIVFNRDMVVSTLTSPLNRIQLCIDGSSCKNADSITYDAATHKAVAAFSGLTNNKTYDVLLAKQIMFEYNGGQRSITDPSNVDWKNQHKFTTIEATVPPSVLSVSPPNASTGVARTVTVTARFSEDMDTSTLTSANFYLDGGILPTSITFDSATKTATFTPSSLLAYDTLYTATITTGVKSTVAAGGLNMSAPNYTWSFRTIPPDTTGPTVSSTSPADGATEIPVSTTVTATFSEAMDPLSITSTSFTLSGGITGTVSYNAATWVATFTPDLATPLQRNTVYTATITTGARDEAGNYMAQNKTWSFTTEGNFTVNNVSLNNYCQIPAFVTSGANSLKPNVLLIIDNSGSMYEFAYKAAGKGYDTSHYDDSYASGTNYYGYFDYTKMYKYNTTSGGYFEVDDSKVFDRTSFWSGNMLNWLTMRRVDVVRKVLVGGKTQPRSANTANYLLISDDPDRDYYKKDPNGVYYKIKGDLRVCTGSGCGTAAASYNLKVFVGNQPPQHGLLLEMADRINFGIMNFNGGYRFEDYTNSVRDGGNVTVDIGATGTNLITQVENTDPTTWTPLAETLYEAIRYFQATTSAYNGGTYSGKDPISASCMKNFVLILTDGESTKDRNLPGTNWTGSDAVSDSYGFNIKTYMDKIGTNEGVASRWNVSPNTSQGSWYLPGVALYAHTTDLRSATVGKSNKDGMQNLSIYSVFAFDDSATGRELLKLTAKYGGFEEGAIGPTSLPTNADNNPTTDPKNWDANNDGIPDTYYEASNGDALKTQLANAFNDILSKVSSGTSASIVNNRGESGANLFQAVFYPRKTIGGKDIYWIGELQNMWYYLDPALGTSSIREDTNYDNKLDLKLDKKVTVDYDSDQQKTIANWYTDTTGGGNFVFSSTGSPDNIKALWRAGSLLHYRTASSRNIKTALSSYNSKYLSNTEPLVSSANSSGFTSFDTTNGVNILNATGSDPANLLNVSNLPTANKVIDYVRGVDYTSDPTYRSRTITIDYSTSAPAPLNTTIADRVWKLGDIVSSTPQAQTSKQLQSYDTAYGDSSYALFYKSADYAARNMVYTAANDGMLHAFRIGQVLRTSYSAANPYRIAEIRNLDTSLNLGDEEWAFIPKNSMPYLKYLGDPQYSHLFYVDNTVRLRDASINKPVRTTAGYECTQSEYWKCEKKTATTTVKACTTGLQTMCTTDADCPQDPDPAISECVPFSAKDDTSWRTVLIGGMGTGGASRDYSGYCNKDDGTTPTSSAQETRLDCVKSPIPGAGLSSFFALDVTEPQAPKFMWEFSDAMLPAADKGIGFATSGPVFVRIAARNPATASYGTPDHTRNGRTFAVFATGSSGPIDTTIHQFLGRSDNTLKVYVVDVHPNMTNGWVKNTNYWVFDSGITNGFAGDLANTSADLDWSSSSDGYYSDDVVYIGYTKPTAGSNPLAWTSGGVLRLLTNDSLDPAHWNLSKLIDNIGPVTSSPARIQDRKNGKLWVFFGTGRYFYKDNTGVDDPDSLRRLYGVYDTCYDGTNNKMNAGFNSSGVKIGCGLTDTAVLAESDLQDQSTTIASALTTAQRGWYITLDPTGDYATGTLMTVSAYNAERVVTNTSAAFNGVVTFTTFKPSNDVCAYGGKTHMWFVDYPTGGVPPAATMNFRTLVQLSSGQFVSIDGKTATKAGGDAAQQTRGDRRTRADIEMHGSSGGEGGSRQGLTIPVRKILHIMEK